MGCGAKRRAERTVFHADALGIRALRGKIRNPKSAATQAGGRGQVVQIRNQRPKAPDFRPLLADGVLFRARTNVQADAGNSPFPSSTSRLLAPWKSSVFSVQFSVFS